MLKRSALTAKNTVCKLRKQIKRLLSNGTTHAERFRNNCPGFNITAGKLAEREAF